MQNDKFSSPFPCVVYTKRPSTGEYVFSHYCNTRVPKSMPRSMRVAHMQEFAQTPKFSTTLSKSVFLVLVAGDVAQCITATNTGEKRTRFLYRGSTYSRPPACTPPPCSDFNRDYIPLHFFSSLTTFLKGTPVGVTHLEAGISLFPRSIRDQDLPTLARWVAHNIAKMVHSSVWITDGLACYNEHTLALLAKTRSHTVQI